MLLQTVDLAGIIDEVFVMVFGWTIH